MKPLIKIYAGLLLVNLQCQPRVSGNRLEQPPALEASGSEVQPKAVVGADASMNSDSPVSHPLAGFFEALRRLEQGGTEPVRVAWLGDSHTAADFLTGRVRRSLQTRFGDGGPGFIPLGLKSSRHDAVLVQLEGRWRAEPPAPASPEPQLDRHFGLLGRRSVSLAVGAAAKARIYPSPAIAMADAASGSARAETAAMRWQLLLRFLTPQASVRVTVGEKTKLLYAASATETSAGVRARASQLVAIDLEAFVSDAVGLQVTAGSIAMYGAIVERVSAGLVLDSLGINGARAWTPLGWNREAWLGEMQERQPSLVVLAYGTNEAADGVELDRYGDAYRALIADLRKTLGGIDCLLIGPTARRDERAAVRVESIDDFQRSLSSELGCAYFSLLDAMGGEFGIWRRASPALVAPDGIHLTRRGYQRLADAVSDWLVTTYEARQLPALSPDRRFADEQSDWD